jgi:hypothetical protein
VKQFRYPAPVIFQLFKFENHAQLANYANLATVVALSETVIAKVSHTPHLLTAAYKPLVPLFSVDLQEQQKGKEKATL